MKFMYFKTTMCIVITLISLPTIHGRFIKEQKVKEASNFTASIDTIYEEFENIIDRFKNTFEHSFDENSTEKLDVTANKLKHSEQTMQRFVDDLRGKLNELDAENQQNTSLYQFINILVKAAHELQMNFIKVYKTLISGLNRRLKALALANELTKVMDPIMSNNNLGKINSYLEELKKVINNRHTKVREGINIACSETTRIWREYNQDKNNKTKNSAKIRNLRKRLPYR